MWRLAALWPALLLALFGLVAEGVLPGDPHLLRAVGFSAVWLTGLVGALALDDPWRLGRGARLLPAALLVTVGASWWASEIPRAGRIGVLLLPAFVLLPAATSRLVAGRRARRLAIAAWGAALTLISCRALLAFLLGRGAMGADRLGDRDLFAIVLAVGLPVAALGWREAGTARWIAGFSTLAGLSAMATSRSLVGLLAVGVACAIAWRRMVRGRELLLGFALLSLGLLTPSFASAVAGSSPEATARWLAMKADFGGALERPWLGWGPGSGAWTEAGFHLPHPGLGKAEGGLGALRSTFPLLSFELGFPALALILALAVVLVRARAASLDAADDVGLAVAGSASLAAGCVGLAAGSWLTRPELALELALVLGFLLAGEGRAPSPMRRRTAVAIAAGYSVAVIWIGGPALAAEGKYERARTERDSGRRAELLAEAVKLDPEFPLYEARAAWEGSASDEARSWRRMAAAAGAARGVSPFWLRTAELARLQGRRVTARRAAARAMALDPLSAAAPFLLHLLDPREIDCAARALIAEPRLAASVRWRGAESQRRRVVARAARWPGIDEGWRVEFLRQVLAAAPRGGGDRELVIRIDDDARSAVSSRVFRRSPWPLEILRLSVDRAAAARIRIRPASRLASTSRSAFPQRRCAPAEE